jgi:hypothetical protein
VNSDSTYQKGQAVEDAVTASLPGTMEAYFFVPLLIVHSNGHCYGVLDKGSAAAWQQGLDAKGRLYFHLEDMDGNRVVLETPHGQGHAHVIMEKLKEKRT